MHLNEGMEDIVDIDEVIFVTVLKYIEFMALPSFVSFVNWGERGGSSLLQGKTLRVRVVK